MLTALIILVIVVLFAIWFPLWWDDHFVDQLNDTMSMCEGLKFIIEDSAFKMLDGWGHKIQRID